MSLSTGNRIVRVAATQINCVLDRKQNVENAVAIVREAAAQGANIILLQELFESVYFCQVRVTIIS
jgi:N-carbamoylputrescine amidase